ncbi:DUF3037 domain-containing protein, partial [Frankia canadensis]|uniref:DUF3037 domain-containing protein n=1 Tax=Frankia canadensis TaxID=1836972 RepID=UPI000E1F1B5A
DHGAALYPHHDWASADAAAGPAGRLAPGERFRWLTAPRSTVVQTSPVHTGLTCDAAAELERLAALLVDPPAPPAAGGGTRPAPVA